MKTKHRVRMELCSIPRFRGKTYLMLYLDDDWSFDSGDFVNL